MSRTINDSLKSLGVIDEVFKVYEDLLFVTGDSPVTHNFRGDTGETGQAVVIINDGIGDLKVAVSPDGALYSDDWTMQPNETLDISDVKIHSIRVTWIANTAYRILVY